VAPLEMMNGPLQMITGTHRDNSGPLEMVCGPLEMVIGTPRERWFAAPLVSKRCPSRLFLVPIEMVEDALWG